MWCGVLPGEAATLCYAAGQGYGNAWNVCIEHPFAYAGGGVTIAYTFRSDTEDGFDFSYVYIDSSGAGDRVEAISYTGQVNGSASVSLTQGIELPSVPKPIKILFCFESDGAWSDQDGLNPTACGAFAVDNVSITGAIVHTADFEANNGGWVLSAPAEGLGGEWSNLYHLNQLPAPLTPCACALTDTVLALPDDNNSHNERQDNLVASPWIDLKENLTVGATGKIIKTNIYAELPLLNYIFVQFNAQYPEKCIQTGKLITSPWTSNGFVYYFGGVPQCTSTAPGTLGTQIDFSAQIPAGAEQVRIALGCLSYCRFFANCTQVSNTTPWFDNSALGVYGNPGVPFIFSDGIDRGQDSFPSSGFLGSAQPGRIDCNNIQGDSQPEVGTTMGDTLIAAGAVGNAEVYIHFRVTPGPGTSVANFNAWNLSHAVSGIDGTFRRARCDTAEFGGSGAISGTWMTTYHESDPNFAGNDRTTDPNDITPTGGTWRLENDIFPDNLFTAGTRIDYFFSANNVGSGTSLLDPATAPGVPYEVEVLPSSFDGANQFNCTLYVDHFNRGAQVYIEEGLGVVLGFGSANNENTRWDRYDVNAESSQQGSYGRPLQTDYGATVVQTLGYRNILWDTGNLNAFNLTKEDADVLNPWLTLLQFDNRNLYLSGDGVVFSPISEAESEPSARRLVEDLAGVTVRASCTSSTASTFRNANCPAAGSPQDLTACVNLDPVAGSLVANSPVRAEGHRGQGNGCPQLRSFDVFSLLTPDFGTSRGDERYSSAVKSADYASVSQDAASSGTLHYRIVADGVSVHYRRDADAATCAFADPADNSVTERLREVSTYFSAALETGCLDVAGAVGLPNEERQISVRTTLSDFAPNPLISGAAGRIQFTMKAEGKATIDVFDIEGRLVKTIYDGLAKEDINNAFWNGTDETGRQVASGVYFYRLRTTLGDDRCV
jgi:hypothetical protein